MLATKWFFYINFDDNSLIKYVQFPLEIEGCTDLRNCNESEIADLNWAGKNQGLLTYEAAVLRGFLEADLTSCRDQARGEALEINTCLHGAWVLTASPEALEGGWETFSDNEKNEIITYRQVLADMVQENVLVQEDVFNPVWPVPPTVLVNFHKNN